MLPTVKGLYEVMYIQTKINLKLIILGATFDFSTSHVLKKRHNAGLKAITTFNELIKAKYIYDLTHSHYYSIITILFRERSSSTTSQRHLKNLSYDNMEKAKQRRK